MVFTLPDSPADEIALIEESVGFVEEVFDDKSKLLPLLDVILPCLTTPNTAVIT